jgi:hypothetical protein
VGNLWFFDWPSAVDLFVIRVLAGSASAYAGIRAVDFFRMRFASGPDGKGPRPVRPPVSEKG